MVATRPPTPFLDMLADGEQEAGAATEVVTAMLAGSFDALANVVLLPHQAEVIREQLMRLAERVRAVELNPRREWLEDDLLPRWGDLVVRVNERFVGRELGVIYTIELERDNTVIFEAPWCLRVDAMCARRQLELAADVIRGRVEVQLW